MKLAKLILAIITLSITGLAQSDLSLRFDKPASRFTESSPLGNGRIGAMIFGDIAEDRIVLNEGTLWSGGPQDSDRPDAAKYLPEIKRLLLEGRNDEAEKIVYDHFTCQGKGSGYANGKDLPYGSYQMLANLRLTFKGGGTAYARVLDLRTAISKLTYVQEGITYTREAFVSAPDQALIIRITASKPGAISFSVTLDRPERASTTVIGNDRLLLTGQLNNGTDGKGMKFASALRLIARSGSVSAHDSRLEVDAANEAIIIVTAATDYMGFAGRRTSDPAGAATRDLQRASGKSFAALESAHIADYQKYFNRVSLSLPAPEPVAQLSTPERLRRLASGKADPSLIPLYFQYGRYLLISSSRPGGVPANLQGIWAEELQAPWNADWHLNVNIQMNYWPAEIANLSELHDPLFSLIESLQMPGARTARLYYGADDPKGGAVEHGARLFDQPQALHRPEVYPGIGADEAAELLRGFFAERR